MAAKVLSVGQCGFDGPRVAQMLRRAGIEVERADSAEDARELVAQHAYDLILVNRILASDGDSGITLIAELKQQGVAAPLMLVSDYDEAQAQAVANGAIPGFGKSTLGMPAAIRLIQDVLAKRSPPSKRP